MIEFDKGKTGFLLTVDPATKLISSIEMKVDPEQFSRGPPNGQEIAIEQFGWKAGAIATELPKDHSFVLRGSQGLRQGRFADRARRTEGSSACSGNPRRNSP